MSRRSRPTLMRYPDAAFFGRKFPKSKFYEHGRASRRLKDLFVKQVDEIVWQYKLAPGTLNLPATPEVAEIQVFVLRLRVAELSREVLRCMDQSAPYPLFFELVRTEGGEEQRQLVAAYKRPNATDAARSVLSGVYFDSPWLPADAPRAALPVALDLAGLYEQLLHPLIPLPARAGEGLAGLVARVEQAAKKQREVEKTNARLGAEKQFNRKVAINADLRRLRTELDELRA